MQIDGFFDFPVLLDGTVSPGSGNDPDIMQDGGGNRPDAVFPAHDLLPVFRQCRDQVHYAVQLDDLINKRSVCFLFRSVP